MKPRTILLQYLVYAPKATMLICMWGVLLLVGCSSSRTVDSAKNTKKQSSVSMKGGGTLSSKKIGEVQYKVASTPKVLSPSLTPLHKKIIAEAESWLGVPYSYAGITRFGIDCSALMMNIYNALGIPIPRTAAEQFEFGTEVAREEMLPGDLVFFNTTGSPASHVGIMSSSEEFIHASSSIGVTKQKLSDTYFSTRWSGARRIISLPKPKAKQKVGKESSQQDEYHEE